MELGHSVYKDDEIQTLAQPTKKRKSSPLICLPKFMRIMTILRKSKYGKTTFVKTHLPTFDEKYASCQSMSEVRRAWAADFLAGYESKGEEEEDDVNEVDEDLCEVCLKKANHVPAFCPYLDHIQNPAKEKIGPYHVIVCKCHMEVGRRHKNTDWVGRAIPSRNLFVESFLKHYKKKSNTA